MSAATILPPGPPERPFVPNTPIGDAALQIQRRVAAGMAPLAIDAPEIHVAAIIRINAYWRSLGWFRSTYDRMQRYGAEATALQLMTGFRSHAIDLV